MIDGDTKTPAIYTGSPNFSKASENSNDENVLEIKGNTHLAQAYVAELMRLYNHYRARPIWNKTHEKAGKKPKPGSEPDRSKRHARERPARGGRHGRAAQWLRRWQPIRPAGMQPLKAKGNHHKCARANLNRPGLLQTSGAFI
ncbi:hypothetical protein I6F31_04195 [Bradyrhizobium sp. NBAIM01]|nr:hypothetical protein [Bradyrhizobium sp. NBAIM01]